MLRVIIAIILGVISLGCKEEDSLVSSNPDLYEVNFMTLDKFGQEERTYLQGDEIVLLLSIKNTSNRETELKFPSSCQINFKVLDEAGDEVQTAFSWQTCNWANTSFTLSPGETKNHQAVWNQKLYQDYLETDSFISTGNYTIKAFNFGIDLEAIREVIIE